jgi:hypothetical protein
LADIAPMPAPPAAPITVPSAALPRLCGSSCAAGSYGEATTFTGPTARRCGVPAQPAAMEQITRKAAAFRISIRIPA